MSPALISMSAGVFLQWSIFDEIRIDTLPTGGFEPPTDPKSFDIAEASSPAPAAAAEFRCRRQFKVALRFLDAQNHLVPLL